MKQVRNSALQDAMRQAMIQGGAHVQTQSELSLNVLEHDNVKIRAQGVVKDVVVIDEWLDQETDLFHILIRARVEPQSPDDALKDQQRYLKKIAITQFEVLDRYHIHDLPGIEILLPKELARRLERQAPVTTVDATQYLFPNSQQPYIATGRDQKSVLVELADNLAVQFILAGTILDFGVTDHPLGIQLRHVELELRLLDGISGALLGTYRENGSVWQDRLFDFPTTTPVMNDKFFAGPIGQQTNIVMNKLLHSMSNQLVALPFTARVVQAKGKQIIFDVGALANVQVGDVLMAYRLADDPVFDAFNRNQLGYPEQPVTSLVVKTVQPLFGMGELDIDTVKLKAGDVVRFAW